MTKDFWKATFVRCVRTFLTTVLGVWTGGQLITEIDWKFTLISAISTTLYILILCIIAGLPEIDGEFFGDDDDDEEDDDGTFDESEEK